MIASWNVFVSTIATINGICTRKYMVQIIPSFRSSHHCSIAPEINLSRLFFMQIGKWKIASLLSFYELVLVRFDGKSLHDNIYSFCRCLRVCTTMLECFISLQLLW